MKKPNPSKKVALPKGSQWRSLFVFMLVTTMLGVFSPPKAAAFVWSGGGGNNVNWAWGYNWTGTGPRDGFNGTFVFGGSANLNNNNNLAGGTAAGITFCSGAGAFVISGNPIVLSGNVQNDSASIQTINLNMSSSATRTATTSSGDIALSGILSGAGGIAKGNSGNTLYLAGANTFTGPVSILNGRLSVSSLNKVASPGPSSNLGRPATAANGIITFGTGMQRGQLQYTGTGETTDRGLKFGGTGGILLDQSGTGLLKFTGSTTNASPTYAYLLQLQGSTAGTGEFAGVIANGANGGVVSVAKHGTGQWTLSGVNTYTGATDVNAGTLIVNGNQAAASGTVTVAAGAALGGTGTIGGNVHFDSEAMIVFAAQPLKVVAGRAVTFDDLRIEDVAGLQAGVVGTTYTLIQGGVNFANVFDRNAATPVNIGGGKSAYFKQNGGNLQVVIAGETYAPETLLVPKYDQLALTEIKPRGWILKQLMSDAAYGEAALFLSYRPQSGTGTWVTKNGNAGAGETGGNWLDGAIRTAYYTGDAALKQKVNDYVAAVLGAQEANGYIGNMPVEDRYKRLGRDLFSDSRIAVALLAYYEFTGNTAALNAVTATARLNMDNYTPDNRPFNHMTGDLDMTADINGHGLMYADVCEWLYRLTGERKYISYAAFLYNDYSVSTVSGPDDTKLGALLTNAHYVGHGAHVAEHLRVPLFLAYNDARTPMGQAATNGMAKVGYHIVPSGAMVSCEGVHDLPPDPWQGYEYCATTELTATLASAVEKTGNMQYADKLERLVFNAAQGARLPAKSTAYTYGPMNAYLSSSTLPKALAENMNLPYPNNDGDRWQLSNAHQMGGSCCSANLVKVMPYFVSSMWMKPTAGGGIAALHYGPSQVNTIINNVAVTINENTEYPFADSISFVVTAATDVSFPLYLRVPAWAGNTTVTAPAGATLVTTGNLRKVTKLWHTGDTVTMTFQNPVMSSTCSNGEVSINRGPLLYVEPYATTTTLLEKSRGGVPVFYEWELTPTGNYRTWSRHYLEPSVLGAAFTVTQNPSYDANYPFVSPRLFLQGNLRINPTYPGPTEPVELCPMGAWPYLRFAAFHLTE